MLDLSGFRRIVSPNTTVQGRFGISVAGLQDVNGDHRGDVAVGAYHEPAPGGDERAGRVYTFDGVTGELLHAFSSPAPTQDGWFGRALAGAPDVNRDGFGDLLVGAPNESDRAGRAYLFDGKTGALLQTYEPTAPEAGQHFGYALAGVPDCSGDGLGDVLVGALNADNDAGRAYVFSGSTGRLLHQAAAPNPTGDVWFGRAVSGAEDFTGDGLGDLIIAAGDKLSNAEAGTHVYLFNGASGELAHTLAAPAAGVGASEGENLWFGYSVSSVRDATGDGLAETIVGARPVSVLQNGRAYVFDSSRGSLVLDLAPPTSDVSGWFGAAVCGVSRHSTAANLFVGSGEQVHLFDGTEGDLNETFFSPEPEAMGFFGHALAAVPDVDGDGTEDVVVGADGEGENDEGCAYIFYTGSYRTPTPSPTPTVTPTPTDSPSPTPTRTPSPTPTPSTTPGATLTPTRSPAATPTPTATATATPAPTATPSPTPTPTPTESPTPRSLPTSTPTPADSPTPHPTATCAPSPTTSPTHSPTPSPTGSATPTPSPTPTPGCSGIECVVLHFYREILGRQPSEGELDGWTTGYFAWLTAQDLDVRLVPSEMGRQFFLSPEYINKGADDVSFIADSYNAFLYRDPSQAEIDGWTPVAYRKEAISIFSRSEEFLERVTSMFPGMEGDPTRNFVADLYLGLLDRLPDPEGLNYAARLFDEASDKRAMAKQMGYEVTNAAEYIQKQNTPDRQIESLYRAYLGRYPNITVELPYWSAELESGRTTLAAMIEAFADSVEFAMRLEEYFPGEVSTAPAGTP